MELAIIILLLAISMASMLMFVVYYFKVRKFIKVIAQLIIDNQVLKDKLDESMSLNSKEFSDGFIKFLSESRESAFKYIEDVQTAIQRYLDAVNIGTEDEIVTARMELFSHLPEKPDKV